MRLGKDYNARIRTPGEHAMTGAFPRAPGITLAPELIRSNLHDGDTTQESPIRPRRHKAQQRVTTTIRVGIWKP